MGASTAPPAVMFKRHAPASTPSLTVTPPMASFRQPPAPGITTKFKDPSAPSSLTAYLKKGAAANRIFPEVTDRRGPTSLNPPRRDPAPKKNQQQQQGEGGQDLHQQEPSTASSASVRPTQSTEQPQQQQQQQHNQHQQGQSNLTMTTIGSNQSHPTSILGLPFSDSPEMLPRELPAAKPQPATTATASSSEGSGHASSGLLLTKSLSVSKHQVNSAVAAVVAAGSPTIPEIAVAPATSSTVETSSQEDKQPRFMTKPQNEVIATRSRMPPLITFDQPSSGSGIPIAYQSSLSTEAPKFKPSQQGIESFYQLGNLASTSNNFQQRPDDLLMRSSRERAPTPYPQSLMSMEESGLSEDARSMLDLDQVVHSTGISSPPLYVATGLHNHQLHLQNPYMLNQQQLSISQFPTLDGYPLIKSPSTIRMSTSGGGESGLDVNSGGGGSEGTGRHDHPQESSHSTGLALPTMLPLSRTPTIQNSENEYGASFHMESDEEGSEGDEDVKEEKEEDEDVEALYKTIGEADDSYIQEYHHSYPLFSLNTPLPKSNMPGFFGLPNNREISGTTISKSLPSRPPPITTSLERPKPKEPSSTQRPEQPSSRTIMEQQDFLTLDRREDPIERVLLSASPDPELYQRQQQLQRSRSVASWAREQARIQVKRNKKRAVAMKAKTKTARQTRIAAAAAAGRIPEEDEYEDVEGEEKEDEAEESETYSSSDFSSLSDISSSTQGSSSSPITPLPPSLIEPVVAVLAVEVQQEKPQQPLRRDSGPIRVRGQGVVKRDGPIEYMVPEENEEEEEQQGFYMDTDDVLSPSSFERESIGAGVGRP
ncbi:hypothetical protein BGZ83_010782 [Gryganskiella cystojenkinii]|nr:hypothetical protein BGZ83_010782 [Gryganskiella cystojenkinii]